MDPALSAAMTAARPCGDRVLPLHVHQGAAAGAPPAALPALQAGGIDSDAPGLLSLLHDDDLPSWLSNSPMPFTGLDSQ